MELRQKRSVRLLRRLIEATWWLSWALGVGLLVVLPVYDLAGGSAVMSPLYDVEVEAEPRAGDEGVAVRGWGEGRLYGTRTVVELVESPAWFRGASVWSWGVSLGLFLFFLYHLRQLARRVASGAAFDEDNARRLRLMGGALLGAEVADGVTMWWQSHVVVGRLTSPSLEFGRVYELDVTVLFVAVVLFVLAEIFRHGTLLEEDSALTV